MILPICSDIRVNYNLKIQNLEKKIFNQKPIFYIFYFLTKND